MRSLRLCHRYQDYVEPASLSSTDRIRVENLHASQDAKAEQIIELAERLRLVADKYREHPETRLARLQVRHEVLELAAMLEEIVLRPDV